MKNSYTNLCTRCGKPRIVVKTWKEKLGNSTIIATKMACPDKECQAKVDLNLERDRVRHENMKLRSHRRM
jgi:hypothetical protein